MRVVILTDNAYMGGVNRYCLLLGEGLRQRGIDVRMACLTESEQGWLFEAARQASITVDAIPVTSMPRTVTGLRRYLQTVNPDLVHLQGYRSSIWGQLAAAGLSIPIVRTVHGLLAHLTFRLKVYDVLDRVSWRTTNRLITVSKELREKLITLGYPHERISAVPNGVHVEGPVNRPNRSAVIGWVGRLSPEKGTAQFADVIAAVGSKNSRANFLIVGDGPERMTLEATVHQARLSERVRFVGEQRDIGPFLRDMDVLVMPSKVEGLPFALIEAMGTGMPAVANAVGGVPEVIVDGQNGFLLDSQDTGGFVDAVLRLVEDPQLRGSMGINAHHHVLRQFSVDNMAAATLDVYRGLTNDR